MKHALVVGGTGMLSNVVLWLIAEGYQVSVIARDAVRMNRLIEKIKLKSAITPILVDYKNDIELQTKVNAAIEKNGAIDIVIAWIHSNAPKALKVIAKEMSANQKPWELFHVLGSSSDLNKVKKEITVSGNCSYFQIQLGFIIEDERSRWLTNEEISKGVIEALNRRNNPVIIGQVEPWEMRR